MFLHVGALAVSDTDRKAFIGTDAGRSLRMEHKRERERERILLRPLHTRHCFNCLVGFLFSLHEFDGSKVGVLRFTT